MIDRAGLAEFLRRRREALQPEDVGLPRGQRRRTEGLRREEVAVLCHMSTDYYARLERERGPQPSEQMIASIAQGLHLSLDERDHLFRLAGHQPPARGAVSRSHQPRPAADPRPAAPTLPRRSSPSSVRRCGRAHSVSRSPGTRAGYTGPARSIGYRWFTDPAAGSSTRPRTTVLSRMCVSGLRGV